MSSVTGVQPSSVHLHISLGSARYFVIFIEDRSRWYEVYFLRTTTEVSHKFQEFKCIAENQTGYKIKALQANNRCEFCNGKINACLQNARNQHRLTVPRTPKQNGVAEQQNSTLIVRMMPRYRIVTAIIFLDGNYRNCKAHSKSMRYKSLPKGTS